MGNRVNKAVSRLLNQFSDSQEWEDLITALVARLEDTDIVLDGLLLYRTLETAEGVWLDQVGDIVGYPRPAKQVDDAGIFTLKAVGDADNADQGLSSLSAMDGGVLTGVNGNPLNEDATDADYRNWLKGKVRATYADATVPSIFQFVDFVFGDGTCAAVEVPAVGEVTIELATALNGAERLVLKALAPRVAAISLELINWP